MRGEKRTRYGLRDGSGHSGRRSEVCSEESDCGYQCGELELHGRKKEVDTKGEAYQL